MKRYTLAITAIVIICLSCILLANAAQKKQQDTANANLIIPSSNKDDPDPALEKVRGKPECTLLDKGKGEKIELYSDDSEITRYNAYGHAVKYYQIVRVGPKSRKVLLTYKKFIPKDKTLATMSLAVTDMLVSDDDIKILVQDDVDIVYVERSLKGDNQNIIGKSRRVYTFKWIPSLNAGRVLDAVFQRPDIIRISNSTGAQYCLRITCNDNGFPVSSLVWKNGVGESITSKLRYPHDKPLILPACPYISAGSLTGYDRISGKARKSMLETMRKNAGLLKVEDGPTDAEMPELAGDTHIHIFGR